MRSTAQGKKNKVLLVTWEFPPIVGGVAQYLETLCDGLDEEVAVVTPRYDGWEGVDRSKPYRIFRYRGVPFLNSAWVAWHILLAFIRERPRVCLISSFSHIYYAAAVWVLRKLLRVPYAVITYGTDLSYSERLSILQRTCLGILRQADLVITISRESVERACAMGCARHKMRILYPCVDIKKFQPAQVADTKRRYGLDGKMVLLTVGRLVKRKGHELVIRALPAVKERFPEVVYLIVGNGPYQDHLEEVARQLGLEGTVIFAGPVSDEALPQYYSACDLFVMPSYEPRPGDYEGFGIVFLEANACGKPVIGGKSGGIPDAIAEEVSGLLVLPRESEVAAAIMRLLGDRDLALRLGEEGRRRATEEFSASVAIGRFREIRRELEGMKHPRCTSEAVEADGKR